MEQYKKIKKYYGERFAKLCKRFFPELIENQTLFPLLNKYFASSKILYDDLLSQDAFEDFRDFIYRKLKKGERVYRDIAETPEELMKMEGYTLYECKTFSDVLNFRKYYNYSEELCTFRDRDRIKTHHIFFAVKDNVDEFHRGNFPQPERQDDYGTSVISLQFSKRNNYLSIKNRYNHSVKDCDATFSNDLDNIHPGLADSFSKYYNLRNNNISDDFELEGYVVTSEGEYIKYNHEMDACYFCGNNIVVKKGEKYCYDKSRYELIDYFLIDKKNKTIECLIDDLYGYYKDSFVDSFKEIKKIDTIINAEGNREIIITRSNDSVCYIGIDSSNRIISYRDDGLKVINDHWLHYNTKLKALSIPNVHSIGECFNAYNEDLEVFDGPKVNFIGDWFLYMSSKIKSVNLPNVIMIGEGFLSCNHTLLNLDLPLVKNIGKNFLSGNVYLSKLNIPKVMFIGDGFLSNNYRLVRLDTPALLKIGDNFLKNNEKSFKILNAPLLREIGDNFLEESEGFETLNASKLRKIGDNFLYRNNSLNEWNSAFGRINRGRFALQNHPNGDKILKSGRFNIRFIIDGLVDKEAKFL